MTLGNVSSMTSEINALVLVNAQERAVVYWVQKKFDLGGREHHNSSGYYYQIGSS
jgi:hypothetical protein